MKILDKVITCSNIVIANKIYIPETILEKAIGLRGKRLDQNDAWLWEFPGMQLQLFDCFGVPEMIGCIALDQNKQIIDVGLMKPYTAKIITCAYWIEVKPDKINNIYLGNTLTWA